MKVLVAGPHLELVKKSQTGGFWGTKRGCHISRAVTSLVEAKRKWQCAWNGRGGSL